VEFIESIERGSSNVNDDREEANSTIGEPEFARTGRKESAWNSLGETVARGTGAAARVLRWRDVSDRELR
jgi:hypothetical protein